MELGWTAICLGTLYLGLCLVVAFQISRIFFYRHRFLSFQSWFLVLCLFWTLPRVIFWFCTTLSDDASNFLYWFPMMIQFTMFSLFILYYMSILFGSQYHDVVHCTHFLRRDTQLAPHHNNSCCACSRHNIFFGVFGIVNAIFAILYLVWIFNLSDDKDFISRLGTLLTGVLFLILMIILILSAYVISVEYRSSPASGLTAPHLSTVRGQVTNRMLLLTYVIASIFVTRSVYDFASISSASVADLGSLTTDVHGVDLFGFFMFILWEIIPTSIILWLFWISPQGSASVSDLKPNPKPAGINIDPVSSSLRTNHPSVISKDPKYRTSSTFDDPHRYDSDDELISGSTGGTPARSYGTLGASFSRINPLGTFEQYSFSPTTRSAYSGTSRTLAYDILPNS